MIEGQSIEFLYPPPTITNDINSNLPFHFQRSKKRLSKEQISVVEFPHDKNLLVLAGPGSGKTSCVVSRTIGIAKRLGGFEKIIIFTFSRSACKEIKMRLAALLGDGVFAQLEITTIHAFCLRIVNEDRIIKKEFPYSPIDHDVILNKIIRHIVRNNEFTQLIPHEKNKIYRFYEELCYKKYKLQHLKEDENDFLELMKKRMLPYGRKKEVSIDYSSLIIEFLKISNSEMFNPTTRKYLLFDEIQDTGKLLYDFFRVIANGRVFTCVGDMNQNIFQFSLGSVHFDQHLLVEYPETTTIKLNNNYRSEKEIVLACRKFAKESLPLNPQDVDLYESCGNVVCFQCDDFTSQPRMIKSLMTQFDPEKKLTWAILGKYNVNLDKISEKLKSGKVMNERWKNGNFENSRCVVSTLYQVKGLEFDIVVLVNAVDTIHPRYHRSMKLNDRLDEHHEKRERNAFYVSMSRAKRYFFMLCPSEMKNAPSHREVIMKNPGISGYIDEISPFCQKRLISGNENKMIESSVGIQGFHFEFTYPEVAKKDKTNNKRKQQDLEEELEQNPRLRKRRKK